MKINHNISAIIANNQLFKSENKLAASVERLSSGLKINHSADDPAGMAISQKMRSQIKGLSRASDNALDGVSVIETAEGALGEVHNILQRMRELAVQAANETYTLEDRENVQNEIEALQTEIDRISRDTEFNKTSLLDGSLDQRGYTDKDAVKVSTYSQEVPLGEYKLTVSAVSEPAQITAGAPVAITEDLAGKMVINGETISLKAGDTADEVYEKIRNLGESLSIDVFYDASGNMVFQTADKGSNYEIEISFSNDDLETALGITTTSAAGKDAEVTLGSGFQNTATYKADGDYLTITDRSGFSMDVNLDSESITVPLETTIDIMDVGTMILQVGANEGQTIGLKIPKVDCETLRITNLNVCSTRGASMAIEKIDEAINRVSNTRGSLGAYQNRLERTVTNLDTSEESLTQALSRIEDVDMAEEMTEYTQANVLQQAGVSVLAQANDLPQTVLQLLQ